jgi:hypothetical protein
MNWKNWKLGLIVAGITGFFSVFVAGMVFPSASWKQLTIVLLGSIGKDVMLYLAQNPADKVTFDSKQTATDSTGAVTTSHLTVTQTAPVVPLTSLPTPPTEPTKTP